MHIMSQDDFKMASEGLFWVMTYFVYSEKLKIEHNFMMKQEEPKLEIVSCDVFKIFLCAFTVVVM